ncbi:hypothetical protein MKW98_018266 [Papaver atlanticum]|uniref:E3 ubiquitin-protein ligase ARIH1-like UBA-like domain-containing protein n=1 Tax=Papaver atlanticum TaxID=357466 RepID=A0AAD4X7P6_9MAGN|nr:hypothetical protein MKW98_018266 [Papaver atlanticum]
MYSDDDDLYTDDTSNGDIGFNYEDDELPDEATKEAPGKNYSVMHADVIRQKQEEDISWISNVLAVSRDSAIILLLHYNWNAYKIQEDWFADEEKVRKAVGLSCNALVGQDMINAFASEEGNSSYLLRSYIEDNKEFKWCPAPDCGLILRFAGYVLYKGDRADDNCNLERNTARKHLAKYTHYYERWVANHRSMDKAVESMKNMEIYGQVEGLRFILCLADEKELKFIKDAWEKIIECRRVLKWSYAFGYYLPENEHGKIQFFEYLQGEAESGLESLHRYAEEELQICLNSENPLTNFKIFREELKKQTTATANYFESLATTFKNGLSEVHSQGAANINRERATDGHDEQKYASTTTLHNEFSLYDYFSEPAQFC